MGYEWDTRHAYIGYLLQKVGLKYEVYQYNSDASSNPGAPSFLFHWGNEVMIDRYAKSEIIEREGKRSI